MTAASLARMGSHPTTPFGPASVATLQLWLKSDALAVVADATDIATWTDSGPGGTNGTAIGTKVKYYNSVVNGKPVARWVAGDSRIDSAASASDASQTIFVAASVDLTSARTLISSNVNGGLRFYASASGQLAAEKQGVSGLGNTAAGVVTTNTFGIFTLTCTSGAQAFWANGTAQGTTSNTYTLTGGLTTMVGSGAGANIFKGDIAEVIRYTSVISSSDRIAIHAYLGAKYGVTMGGA